MELLLLASEHYSNRRLHKSHWSRQHLMTHFSNIELKKRWNQDRWLKHHLIDFFFSYLYNQRNTEETNFDWNFAFSYRKSLKGGLDMKFFHRLGRENVKRVKYRRPIIFERSHSLVLKKTDISPSLYYRYNTSLVSV